MKPPVGLIGLGLMGHPMGAKSVKGRPSTYGVEPHVFAWR